ncbi:UDP-N-acetylmuramoyl-tripeptide--D-alanyl-D-alanine ligase [Peribacillus saganii]|uniref:UDP-N-acetylmuramoyl-tripeptide--D-alanyl-D-alanine ligase n=1 Tax=Peribacillus saganii TaxID=2303992 RepID=A0A372LMK3_9BACI|nr:UDP-N-acetylmuramoyl-tripeptide--D-alanyl-D-alanine ligase [Peribacillus saganii]RFU67288.1 UDP-N-acetylmuramoyl-tripeptide--D-alanyl-D-alanine ligase [Peribacillus saganii]
MKPLTINEINQIVHGEFIEGPVNWQVSHAILYGLHRLKWSHTLIFSERNINWHNLKNFQPCAVVTDLPADQIVPIEGITFIKVNHVMESYWKFVQYYRSLFDIPVIAVTGTCGKTTIKEMIKHILRVDRIVQATDGNWNLPVWSFGYLQNIDESTQAAVFETAITHPGHLTRHCRYLEPTIGVFTNIGIDHLDTCGSLEGYIQAKAELVKGLRKNGTLILNGDDENIKKIALDEFKGRVVYYSVSSSSPFQATEIHYAEMGMTFVLNHQGRQYHAFVPGYGDHQVYNALGAISACYELGVGVETSIKRLSTFKNFTRHLELMSGLNDCTILDDTWNTNPTSLNSALQVLHSIGKGKKNVALLGDMMALGEFADEVHRQVAELIIETKLDVLITIGEKAREIGKEAIRLNFGGKVYMYDDSFEGVREMLEELLDQNTILLIKGSLYNPHFSNFAQGLRSNKN